MTNSPQLALAYITKSPASAGRVLSSMPPDASAAFIEQIPTKHAVKLVANMQPATAARIMRNVDGKAAANIFRDLNLGKSSAVVRQMDRKTRDQFLSKLSKRTRIALQKSLSFAPGTVGAHMINTVATLSQTDSVKSALDTIRQSDRDYIDVVFILNDTGNLVGVVSSAVALRHPETAQLSQILDASCVQVSAHNKLDVIADPALWQDFTYLPVVNRRREVIGAISRKALRSGRSADAALASLKAQSVPTSLFAALATTATGLIDLVSTSTVGYSQPGERNEL